MLGWQIFVWHINLFICSWNRTPLCIHLPNVWFSALERTDLKQILPGIFPIIKVLMDKKFCWGVWLPAILSECMHSLIASQSQCNFFTVVVDDDRKKPLCKRTAVHINQRSLTEAASVSSPTKSSSIWT